MTYAAVALVTCSTKHHRALPCRLLRCYVRQRLSHLGLFVESSSERPHLQEASGSPALCTPCHIMRLIALSKEKRLNKCIAVGEAARSEVYAALRPSHLQVRAHRLIHKAKWDATTSHVACTHVGKASKGSCMHNGHGRTSPVLDGRALPV